MSIIKFIALTAVFVLVLSVPLVTSVSAAQDTPQTSAPQQEAAQPQDKTSHFLEWGVMAYAVGEFAGLIGMGISHIRKEKRAAKATAKIEGKLARPHSIGSSINAYGLERSHAKSA